MPLVGMWNVTATLENTLEVSQNLKHPPIVWCTYSTPRHESREMKAYLPIKTGTWTSLQLCLLLFGHVWLSATHELQHARLPWPWLSPGVCSNSCPLSRWCHPTISSSVSPFLLLPSIFPSIRVSSDESAVCNSSRLKIIQKSTIKCMNKE